MIVPWFILRPGAGFIPRPDQRTSVLCLCIDGTFECGKPVLFDLHGRIRSRCCTATSPLFASVLCLLMLLFGWIDQRAILSDHMLHMPVSLCATDITWRASILGCSVPQSAVCAKCLPAYQLVATGTSLQCRGILLHAIWPEMPVPKNFTFRMLTLKVIPSRIFWKCLKKRIGYCIFKGMNIIVTCRKRRGRN